MRLSYALLLGLAAVLVACGGGSSTTESLLDAGFDASSPIDAHVPSDASSVNAGSVDAAHQRGSEAGPAIDAGDDSSGDSICPGQADVTTSPFGCLFCCESNHPGGVQTYLAALTACQCGPSGWCRSAPNGCGEELCAGGVCTPGTCCAIGATTSPTGAFCSNGMSEGDDCTTCLRNTAGHCQPSVVSACSADPDCVAFMACVNQTAPDVCDPLVVVYAP